MPTGEKPGTEVEERFWPGILLSRGKKKSIGTFWYSVEEVGGVRDEERLFNKGKLVIHQVLLNREVETFGIVSCRLVQAVVFGCIWVMQESRVDKKSTFGGSGYISRILRGTQVQPGGCE